MDVVGYIILMALIGGMVILFLLNQPKRQKLSRFNSVAKISRQQINEKWQEIERTYSLGGPSHFKTAIMESDKLVESTLASLNIPGNTFAERLKNAQKLFSNYNDYNNLWFAHKVRNNIAHELNHELNSAEAKRAMEYFKKALKQLGVI